MNFELEKLIGKSIKELVEFGDINEPFQNIDLLSELNNYRVITFKSVENFGGLSLNKMQVVLDDNAIINELCIAFPLIIDRFFYDKIISRYGSPNTTQVIDKILKENKSENIFESKDSFYQDLKKRSFLTKEGKFEDKPIWVLWEKEYYDIKLMFYYKENVTQLIFRKKNEGVF